MEKLNRGFFSCYIYIFFKFSYNLRSIQINHNYFLLPDVIFNGRDRNDLAPNINSNLSNVCSIKVECYLRGCCAGRGLELFWTIQVLLSMTTAILANFLQILTEGQLLLQLKLDSLLWYSACLHSMMPERSWSVDHDDYYAASTHLFGDLCEIFFCSIKLLAMLSGLFISA